MLKEKPKATMEDVAAAAGVSIGTVDRVVHDRAEVSEKTRKKVLTVIDEIGYKPNIYASILSQKRQNTIIVIIPYFQKGEFWELVQTGVDRATEEGKGMNVMVKTFYYNQFEHASFRAACRNAIDAEPNGILIAPIYQEAARELVDRCATLSIPVAYIDTCIDQSEYLAYFGPPLFESGYLAADLLLGGNGHIREVACFNIDRGEVPANNSISLRHKGFEAYLQEHNPECKIYDCWMSPFDFMSNINLFDSFFEEHPAVNHILTLSSRVHLISDWMDIRGVSGKKLLGFDMMSRNIDALRRGRVSTLIANRTDLEAYRAMRALIDFLVLRRSPAKKDNYSSLDILSRYSVDFYLLDD